MLCIQTERDRQQTKGHKIYSSIKKVNLILGMFTFREQTGLAGGHSWGIDAFGLSFVERVYAKTEAK